MALLKDYYNTGDDDFLTVYDVRWWAQTFTPASTYTLYSVKLLVYKQEADESGNVTVAVRATSSGHPVLPDLCSEVFDLSTLTATVTGEWKEIVFSPSTTLVSGTKYAIVASLPNAPGAGNNYMGWRCDGSSPSYSGGNAELNTESGIDGVWDAQAYDFMFETYGEVPGEGQGLIAVVGETFHYVSKTGVEYVLQGTVV